MKREQDQEYSPKTKEVLTQLDDITTRLNLLTLTLERRIEVRRQRLGEDEQRRKNGTNP